jgi:ribosome modulation factor
MPHTVKLRAAYEAGLKTGRSIDGLPKTCPFEQGGALAERFAWLSGFSVGKAVRLRGST